MKIILAIMVAVMVMLGVGNGVASAAVVTPIDSGITVSPVPVASYGKLDLTIGLNPARDYNTIYVNVYTEAGKLVLESKALQISPTVAKFSTALEPGVYTVVVTTSVRTSTTGAKTVVKIADNETTFAKVALR